MYKSKFVPYSPKDNTINVRIDVWYIVKFFSGLTYIEHSKTF